MYDLSKFTLKDMTECGIALRKLGSTAASMEEVASKIVHYFYDYLIDKRTGEKSCALVRFFKTHPYQELNPELRKFADGMLKGNSCSSTTKCLTLLASAGEKPEWNSRQTSLGHQAIPLVSEQIIEQSPMISQLIKQLGLDVSMLLDPDPSLLVNLEQKTYNIFHVHKAVNSPFIPAQAEFVIPFGIKSVLGCGGMLSSGNLYAIIIFSKVEIPNSTAEMFKSLVLSVKTTLLPFDRERVFK